ncbi:hypothetical protein AgCh_004550 [Apium graveolens]
MASGCALLWEVLIAILLPPLGLIREEIKSGKSDKKIYKKLEDEYGETVLYAPKFDMQTDALWLSLNNDLYVDDYKTATVSKHPTYMPHTAERYQARRFRKAQCPIVERMTNSLMMHERNNGKKLLVVRKSSTS